MKVRVVPTHHDGRRCTERELGATVPLVGALSVHLTPDAGLKRAVRFAVLQEIGSGGKTQDLLPPLRNPELLTLTNDGMMLAGFEEVDGRRLYQGWWIRFE